MSKGRRVPPKLDIQTCDTSIADQVSKQDRRYFDDHPQATEYTRPYIAGETPDIHHAIDHVVVTKITANIRQRHFIESEAGGRLLCVDYDNTDAATMQRINRYYGQALHKVGVR